MFGNFLRLLLAAPLFAAIPAFGQIVHFEFCGHSTYSTPMAPRGTPVSGNFSWDVSAVAAVPSPSVNNYYPPQVGTFTIVAGSHKITSDHTWVIVRDYPRGGDTLDINGYSPVIDGTLFHQGYFGIRLVAPDGGNVFLDGRLPSDLNLADFNYPSMNYFSLFSGVAPNELLLDVELSWLGRPETRPGRSERRDCHPRPRG